MTDTIGAAPSKAFSQRSGQKGRTYRFQSRSLGKTELVPTLTFTTVSTDPSDISTRGNRSGERTTKRTTAAKTTESKTQPVLRENLNPFIAMAV
jgi:hypothetical protein